MSMPRSTNSLPELLDRNWRITSANVILAQAEATQPSSLLHEDQRAQTLDSASSVPEPALEPAPEPPSCDEDRGAQPLKSSSSIPEPAPTPLSPHRDGDTGPLLDVPADGTTTEDNADQGPQGVVRRLDQSSEPAGGAAAKRSKPRPKPRRRHTPNESRVDWHMPGGLKIGKQNMKAITVSAFEREHGYNPQTKIFSEPIEMQHVQVLLQFNGLQEEGVDSSVPCDWCTKAEVRCIYRGHPTCLWCFLRKVRCSGCVPPADAAVQFTAKQNPYFAVWNRRSSLLGRFRKENAVTPLLEYYNANGGMCHDFC